MKIQDFDLYDQNVLRSAVQAGHVFAKVVEGPEGPWVALVSQDDPLNILDRSEHRLSLVVKLEEIDGLPAADASPRTPVAA